MPPSRKSLADPVDSPTPRKRTRANPVSAPRVSDGDGGRDDDGTQTLAKRPRRAAVPKVTPVLIGEEDDYDDEEDDNDDDDDNRIETPYRRRGRREVNGEPSTPTLRRTTSKTTTSKTTTNTPGITRKSAAKKKLDDAVNSTSARRLDTTPQTPKTQRNVTDAITPRRRQAADRSARKKSMRALVEHIAGDGGDHDGDYGNDDDDDLARRIYESSSSSEDDTNEDDRAETATPSKTSRIVRATCRRRSPTPPRDLPAHERYFFDTRPGRPRTGDTTLARAGVELLSHEEYFSTARALDAQPQRHADEMARLLSLHAQSFPQWAFELNEGFGVCLHGAGSKRVIIRRFASFLATAALPSAAVAPSDSRRSIVVVNGYVRNISPRDILVALWPVLYPAPKPPSLPTTTTTIATLALPLPTAAAKPYLLLNSIDSPTMRRPAMQALVATIRPHVRFLCTADTADFHLLWDAGRRGVLDLVFHDCTTLMPRLAAELDVVDDVHELLGRKARRAGGREGVAFVLRSLPDKARKMFRLLVAEVLLALDEDDGDGEGDMTGVEWRMVYNKAIEEFICSNEMSFRTLLKEFHDHQMIISRTDSLGTEMLSVPFRKDELEAIFEDLCADEG